MKNNMQVMYSTLTSMEVAEMVEKTHDNLIKSIRRYSKYIDESNASLDAVKNDAVPEEDNLKQLKNEVVKAETIDLQEFRNHSIKMEKDRPDHATTSPRKAASSLRISVLEEKERSLLPDISTDFTKWRMKLPGNALKPRKKCQMWRIVQHHRRKTGIGRTFGR